MDQRFNVEPPHCTNDDDDDDDGGADGEIKMVMVMDGEQDDSDGGEV